jgi:hypothetical protein
MDLQSIWDEPLAEAITHPSPKDQPDDTINSEGEHDIEKLFAGIDDANLDDSEALFKPLPKFDIEAERRKAKTRHKVSNAMDLDTLEPPSSSQPANDDSGAAGDKMDGEREPRKQKKRPMRLDEGRLIGPNGFRRLMRDTKNLKLKGKGHEARPTVISSSLTRLSSLTTGFRPERPT